MSLYNSLIYSFYEDETKLFSTSPLVYADIENIIESGEEREERREQEEREKEIVKLRYSVVLKDIIIVGMKKKMKEYEWSHRMWSDFTRMFLS